MQNPFVGMSISALAAKLWELEQQRARCLSDAVKALEPFDMENEAVLHARIKIRDTERTEEELALARSAKKGAENEWQQGLMNRALAALRTVDIHTPDTPESVVKAVCTARDLLREMGARNE